MKHDGYIRVNVPGRGLVMEHRLVAEGKLARPLRRDEWVNHIDGVRTNNSEDNLEVVPSAIAQYLDSQRRAWQPREIADYLAEISEYYAYDTSLGLHVYDYA